MEDKEFVVYCHTNKINNKKYVGITSTEPYKRWKNGKGYIGQKFYNAIQKYGWDNFEHKILFRYDNEEDCLNKEKELIKLWDLTNDKYGYNISLGGDKTTLGLKYSDETKKLLSEQRLGIPKPNLCKGENPMSERVVFDGIIYNSVIELAESLDIDVRKIYSWLNGNVYMPIEYYNKGLSYIDKDNKIKIKIPKIYFNGVYYYNSVDFSKDYGFNRHTVSSWVKGKNGIPKYLIDLGLKIFADNSYISEKCYIINFNNKTFYKLKDLSEYCGVTESKLSKYLKGVEKMPTMFEELGLSLKEL